MSSSAAAAGTTRQQHSALAAAYQKRLHSTRPKNNGNNKPGNSNNNTFSTRSTLSTLITAGTGTLASTLLALYLATIVETSAHEFLYEYFPHWYYEIATEDLPTCLKPREVARRVTGVVELNRARGLGEGGESLVMMGMDGWMEQRRESSRIVDAELLAELEFEKRQSERVVSVVDVDENDNEEVHEQSVWQRKMTEKRASIIEKEEEDFVSLGSPQGKSNSSANKSGVLELEAKKIQEEAAKKLQERLMSVAMTA